MKIYGATKKTRFSKDMTKDELKSRIKRQNARIAALETHINANSICIKRNILEFQKSKEGTSEKFKKVHFWCIVERKEVVFSSKPKGVELEERKNKKGKLEYVYTHINVLNVFLTKQAAETHLEENIRAYPKKTEIKPMFPISNEEMKYISKHFLKLGENLPETEEEFEEN